jgi:hypothetical protein
MIEQTFNGSDYDHNRDSKRLTKQHYDIFNLMKDSVFRSLQEIEKALGYPQPSISAQLRHFRKARFGSHTVNKQYLGNGLYQYQLVLNDGSNG